MKIFVSCLIFVSLFASAWVINNKEKREFYVPGAYSEDLIEGMPIRNVLDPREEGKVKAFEPREYVRISSVM